jgi:hypothetical protein
VQGAEFIGGVRYISPITPAGLPVYRRSAHPPISLFAFRQRGIRNFSGTMHIASDHSKHESAQGIAPPESKKKKTSGPMVLL